MRIFGSVAYAKNTRYLKNLENKAGYYVFVGYAPNGYLLFHTQQEKIVTSRDVKILDGMYPCDVPNVKKERDLATLENLLKDDMFWETEDWNSLESEIGEASVNSNHDERAINVKSHEVGNENNVANDSITSSPTVSDAKSIGTMTPENDETWHPSESYLDSDDSEIQTIIPQQNIRRYPDRPCARTKLFPEPENDLAQASENENQSPSTSDGQKIQALLTLNFGSEPQTYNEAMASENKDEWYSSMCCEMEAMKKNKVWTLVPRPKNAHVVRSKRVYKLKKQPGQADLY